MQSLNCWLCHALPIFRCKTHQLLAFERRLSMSGLPQGLAVRAPLSSQCWKVLLCLVLPITSSELSRSLLSNVNDIVLFYNIIWWRYQLYSIWTALWTFLEAFLIRSRIFLQARTVGTGGKSKSIKASGPVHAKTHQGFRWIDLDGLHYALSKNKSSRYLSNLA